MLHLVPTYLLQYYVSKNNVNKHKYFIKLEYDVNIFGMEIRKNQDKKVSAVNISITNLQSKVRYIVNYIVDQDYSLDSTHVLTVMYRAGN